MLLDHVEDLLEHGDRVRVSEITRELTMQKINWILSSIYEQFQITNLHFFLYFLELNYLAFNFQIIL